MHTDTTGTSNRGRISDRAILSLMTALLLAATLACGGSPTGPDASTRPRIASVIVRPGVATLEPTKSLQFTADVRDANGQPVDASVTWQATGGQIDSQGTYTAGISGGEYEVRAISIGEVIGLSRIKIEELTKPGPNDPPSDDSGSDDGSQDPGNDDSEESGSEDGSSSGGDPGNSTEEPSRATTLVISPERVTVDAGASVQFSVDLRDQYGASMSDPVNWEATGGSITSTGLYVAGKQGGDFTVKARSAGLVARAKVTVQAQQQTQTAGVPIQPGQSIQAAVNANPAGTTFVIKAGVHSRQSVEPKDGMTFVGENGAVLDGGGIQRFAFGSYGPGARDVTVKNLEIRNYMTPITEGAIQGHNTRDWVVEGNEIHRNGGFGVTGGPGMKVLRNHAHHNGDAGIHGYKADGMLVEGNEVDRNGDAGVQDGTYATAAGMKFFKIRDLVVRNNHVHDNGARGIWCDTDCIDVLIEGNRVVENGGFGIWVEISYRTKVLGNHVERNGFDDYDGPGWLGGAGIAVSNSPDVEVAHNTLIDNADGIAGMQATGYPSSGAYGPYQLRNLWVHDNTVVMSHGRNGIATNGGDAVFDSWNNRFDRNRYTLKSDPDAFAWKNGTRDPGEWQGYSQDPNGTFN